MNSDEMARERLTAAAGPGLMRQKRCGEFVTASDQLNGKDPKVLLVLLCDIHII